MKRVYKYELKVDDVTELQLPSGAEILTVQVQYGIPCLWALIDPNVTGIQPTEFSLLKTLRYFPPILV